MNVSKQLTSLMNNFIVISFWKQSKGHVKGSTLFWIQNLGRCIPFYQKSAFSLILNIYVKCSLSATLNATPLNLFWDKVGKKNDLNQEKTEIYPPISWGLLWGLTITHVDILCEQSRVPTEVTAVGGSCPQLFLADSTLAFSAAVSPFTVTTTLHRSCSPSSSWEAETGRVGVSEAFQNSTFFLSTHFEWEGTAPHFKEEKRNQHDSELMLVPKTEYGTNQESPRFMSPRAMFTDGHVLASNISSQRRKESEESENQNQRKFWFLVIVHPTKGNFLSMYHVRCSHISFHWGVTSPCDRGLRESSGAPVLQPLKGHPPPHHMAHSGACPTVLVAVSHSLPCHQWQKGQEWERLMRDNSGSQSDLGLTLSSATFWLSDSLIGFPSLTFCLSSVKWG